MTSTLQTRHDGRSPLAQLRYFTIREVATMLKKSPEHLWRCLRAYQDERIRRARRISKRLLRNLPLEGWRQVGATWVISETDLFRQMTRPY